MLAQNFKTAADLGIADIELDALIRVLGMLERGELVHMRNYEDASTPNGFNMGATRQETPCGTIACLGGWAHIVSGGRAFPDFGVTDNLVGKTNYPRKLDVLFGIGCSVGTLEPLTDEQAACALRSYLTTGDAKWDEALAA